MYVIINGGGKVGSFLAQTLKKHGHDVAIIERRETICQKLANEIPGSLVIYGDGCDTISQKDAGAERADVFASVTGDDDDNLVACRLAKVAFEVPRAIARVNSPKNERIFLELGIDAISTTTVIAHMVEEESTIGDAFTLLPLKKGKLSLIEVELPTDRCKVCNKQIVDMGLPQDCVLVSIIRGEDVVIPKGNTVLEPGDTVIALTVTGKEEELKKILV
jgi:trk system potassium uptake protein TrkA